MRALPPIFCVAVLTACDNRGFTSTTPVTAQPPERRLMRLYDTNDDGRLAPEELEPHLPPDFPFDAIDTDHDGRVSEPELRQALWEQPTRPDP